MAAVIEWMQKQAAQAEKSLGSRGAEKRLALAIRHGRVARPDGARGWLIVPADAPDVQPAARPAPARPAGPPPAVVPRPPRAVIITTHAPPGPVHVVEVAARPAPETTTRVCTETSPAALPPLVDALLEQVEERAGILEFDARHDRDTAERLAREMVMGREAAAPPVPVITQSVGVDHRALAVRMNPLVSQVVEGSGGGRIRLLEDGEEPFYERPAAFTPGPGQCSCRSTSLVDVPIHGGRSIRHDCGRCGKFVRFAVWHGRQLLGPAAISPPPRRSTPPPAAAAIPILPAADLCGLPAGGG